MTKKKKGKRKYKGSLELDIDSKEEQQEMEVSEKRNHSGQSKKKSKGMRYHRGTHAYLGFINEKPKIACQMPKSCLYQCSDKIFHFFKKIKSKRISLSQMQDVVSISSIFMENCKIFDFDNDQSNGDEDVDGKIRSVHLLCDEKVAVVKSFTTEIWDMHKCCIDRVIPKTFSRVCGDYILKKSNHGFSTFNWKTGEHCGELIHPHEHDFCGLSFGSSSIVTPNGSGVFEMWDLNRISKKPIQRLHFKTMDHIYGETISASNGGSCVFNVNDSIVVIKFDDSGMMKIHKVFDDIAYGTGNCIDVNQYACVINGNPLISNHQKICILDLEYGKRVKEFDLEPGVLGSISKIYRLSENSLFLIAKDTSKWNMTLNALLDLETGKLSILNTIHEAIQPIGPGCFRIVTANKYCEYWKIVDKHLINVHEMGKIFHLCQTNSFCDAIIIF